MVTNVGAGRFPSLHHRKGWPSDQEIIAKHPLTARTGWFSDRVERKTTPSASAEVAARNPLRTQPPLLAVMQGGEWPPFRIKCFPRRGSISGFSLVELLIATAITFGLGAAVFQLFHHNERVFRDQALILEMQQTARMVNSAIADDIRIAGQAIPRLDDIVLPGAGASRLNLRAGFTATETVCTAPVPFSVAIGVPVSLAVESTSGFLASRQVFLWNEDAWARAFIDTVYTSTNTLLVTPTAASAAAITFTTPPAISLDEAVAVYRDASTNAVRRTTATNTENSADPSWAPANEIATNVTGLAFVYFDAAGTPLDPSVPGFNSKIASIESRVIVRPSSPLSNGSLPSFTLSIRSFPRNLSYR